MSMQNIPVQNVSASNDLNAGLLESIGWIPLDQGAYLHVGSDEPVIQVVGVAKEEMAGSNVLWLL
jgi:hypothetical protein